MIASRTFRAKGAWTGILLLFLLIACAEQVVEEPEGLIESNTMIDILYDISVLNAIQSTSPGTLGAWDKELMEIIYIRYEIDSTRLAESDAYYASIPIQYKAMYDSVQKRIESKTASVEEVRKMINEKAKQGQADKKKLDSIKKANGVPESVRTGS